MKDLAFHAAAFRSYLNFRLRSRGEEVALLRPTLEKIESLREVCMLLCMCGRHQKHKQSLMNDKKSERISWEITFESCLTKSPSVYTELLPDAERRQRLVRGMFFYSFFSFVPYLLPGFQSFKTKTFFCETSRCLLCIHGVSHCVVF